MCHPAPKLDSVLWLCWRLFHFITQVTQVFQVNMEFQDYKEAKVTLDCQESAFLGPQDQKACTIYIVYECQILFKGCLHPNMKHFVIIHLPECRFNSKKALFVFGTQFKIF